MARNSQNRHSPPTSWAWIATVLTLIIFVLLRALCLRCVPEESGNIWHSAMKITEEGVTEVGTFSLVILVLLADTLVLTAWFATIGLALWTFGLLIITFHGPTALAVVMMMIGSGLILIAHLHHFSRLLFRRWMRILRGGALKRIIVLVLLLIFGASIGLLNILPVRNGSGHGALVLARS